MKELFKNIKSDKLTSTGGIAMLLILLLRAFGIDLGEISGIPIQNIAEIIGGIINAIILLFAKDPNVIVKDVKK